MTITKEKEIRRDIRALVKRSYEDDGNSYELEFRGMLEWIWEVLDKDIKRQEKNKG